jgi:hypothetical protein
MSNSAAATLAEALNIFFGPPPADTVPTWKEGDLVRVEIANDPVLGETKVIEGIVEADYSGLRVKGWCDLTHHSRKVTVLEPADDSREG